MSDYPPNEPRQPPLERAVPSCATHPDLRQAVKSLSSYNSWINEIVMPIVFQWVEEHKEEVYRHIPDDKRDDVGLVIAKAFGIISKLPYFQKGLKLSAEFADDIQKGDFDARNVNATWQQMSAALDEATRSVKNSKPFMALTPTI